MAKTAKLPHSTVMGFLTFHLTGDALWQRMERAVEQVRQRLERTVRSLEQAGIPYAIIGGNAVRAWVAQADGAGGRCVTEAANWNSPRFPTGAPAHRRPGSFNRTCCPRL